MQRLIQQLGMDNEVEFRDGLTTSINNRLGLFRLNNLELCNLLTTTECAYVL